MSHPEKESSQEFPAPPVSELGGDNPFRLIFEHAYQFLGLVSSDGTLLEVNQAALDFGGLVREDVIGRPFWKTGWWSPDSPTRERLREAVQAAAQGEFVRYEAEVRGREGERAAIDFSLTPVLGTDGQVIAIVPEGRVITHLKEVEEELRTSEAKFAGILRGALDAIISINESQTIELFNAGAERIFGYRAEEILGKPLSTLLPERFHSTHEGHITEFGGSSEVARLMGARGEIVGRRKNGEEFPAEASIGKMEVGEHKVYTAVLRDISDRKRIEAEREQLLVKERAARFRAETAERRVEFLAEASRRLAGSLELNETLASLAEVCVPTLGDICVVHAVGLGGEIRRAQVVCRSGMSEARKVLEDLPEMLNPGHPVREVLETGEPALFKELNEAVLARLAGGPRDMEKLRRVHPSSLMILPLAARGVTLGALCFFTAAGERTLGREELNLARELADRASLAVDNSRLYGAARRATRARDEMFRVVSHDLKNPLTAILMGIKMLRMRLASEDGDLPELLEGIEQSATRLNRQVQDLVDVASIEARRLSVEPRPWALDTLLGQAAYTLEPLASAAGIRFSWEVEEGLPLVHADADRIVQVLSNLVDNALKFTPEGGTIAVRAVRKGDEAEIRVSDTGGGIPQDVLPYVFDRFWHGRKPSRGGKIGMGLGLSIARGIVEEHNGAMSVRSQPGRGTTFIFTLPFAPL